MKFFCLLFFLFLSIQLYGQGITGKVIDNENRQPISNAEVKYGSQSTFTGPEGRFNFVQNKALHKITIKHMGYETSELTINTSFTDTLYVYLKPISVNLAEVTINAKKNREPEFLKLEEEYVKINTYQAPILKGVLAEKGLRWATPGSNIISNTTSTILSADLLKVASLLSNNKSKLSKVQKAKQTDEGFTYINEHFSEDKVASITKLKDDSLKTFIKKYRPALINLKKMNDYEILIYIKKSYSEFIKPNN